MRRLRMSGAVRPLPPNTHSRGTHGILYLIKRTLFWPPIAQQPPVGKGLLSIKTPLSHLDTRQSVGFLWSSDQPQAETSTWQHTILTTHRHAPAGIRTRNPSKRAAADPRLTERSNWGRLMEMFTLVNHLTPNDPSSGRTAPLTSKSFILYIYSTNIGTEYFKHGIYSPFFFFKMQFVS